ncbi:Di-copper centre-containing protein [Zopfia rhizophila CBS 207.26]|uniref:tyrosinase n=1 Tax=Zopfia rhizophila CBS 207.26 TaxID=1314779 RepID=A0A6A6DLH7_9PEZI|nr:Di-copper centre-containing protein [Zopfia rhizophila CBS 207.26]
MKSLFTSLAGFAASVSLLGNSFAAPVGDGASCSVTKRSDDYFSIVGVQGTGIHPRLELRQLERDVETWNLFIQALARFQDMDQKDKLSYFQFAGIHGAPFIDWDGVKGEGPYGYCAHSSNLFGTWHRPYLAGFEQVLHDLATEIVNEFPEGDTKKRYQECAKRLRLPYWDWAIDPQNDEGVMPASLRRPTASVTFPNGTSGEIRNPLEAYVFHPLNPEDFPLENTQFGNWKTTIRWPFDPQDPNATSRNDAVNGRIGAQQPNNRDMLYKLLTVYQPFNQWSNKGNGGKIGNLETLHDGIHFSFGSGHMGLPETAAFDPAFWVHHCNVDRIMALYMHRYPDTFVEPAKQSEGTYTFPKDSIQDASSPLTPFHMNAKGDLWTSTTSRDTTSFGYTYPELMGNPDNDTLTLTINRLYKTQTQGLNKNNTLTTLTKRNETADAIDWMAEVNMPSDIQVTYSVRAFLGNFEKDPKKWAEDPNYVGQVASFSGPRRESDVIVTANIALTEPLAKKYKDGELKSLEKQQVLEYLKENFHWRIQQADLAEIPKDNTPKGLNVTVLSVPIHLPNSETEVPTWIGEFEYHPEIKGD